MIEVEKKFLLTPEEESRLLDGAEFIVEKIISDTYYDNEALSLSLRDNWLRKRGDQFELKVSRQDQTTERIVDLYRELETDNEIREFLGLGDEAPLVDQLAAEGYAAFCPCTTTRRKYKKGDFIIDLDAVTYSDSNLTFAIAEIELLVESDDDISDATERILAFAQQHGITNGEHLTYGKVGAYLREEKPDHFQKLIDSGVFAS